MILTTIGLMSGTSLDGVDVALIETDGKQIRAFGPSGYRPYTDRRARVLRQALTEAGICRSAMRGRVSCARPNRRHPAHAEAVDAFPRAEPITARTSTSSASMARPCCTGPTHR